MQELQQTQTKSSKSELGTREQIYASSDQRMRPEVPLQHLFLLQNGN
jgi:hypothetical protein